MTAIVLSNPNNPTGGILRRDEILALAAVAKRHDLWLVCDEIYREICYEEGIASLASCGLVEDRLVILGSLSKSHAMAGWRMGWMIAPPPLVAPAAILADVVFHGLPGFVQEAALLALNDGGAAARDAAALCRRRRAVLLNALARAPGLLARISQAGPFVFCDIRGAGLSGAEFARIAKAEAGVALVAGGRFGHSSAGFVRIALTCPEETLTEAAERLVGLCRRIAAGATGGRSSGAPEAAPAAPEFADGVYISPSGMVHVWRDGELDGIF
jgi:octopine/nopaline transport system ATP-binding protein